MREDPTNDPGPKPRYQWRETWPGEGHRDYRGWDADRPFGRIMHEPGGPTKDLWRWSINYIDGVKKHVTPHNGWEKSPRLAAQKVEDAYEAACELNGLPILSR